ncbi:MAG: YibE/F family protein [Oscillospiraceae bacterium]|nr:YibE/F family protein [Oscillospiraceae bacterium]
MKLLRNKNVIFYVLATLAMAGMVWFGVSTEIDFGRDAMPGVTWPRGRVVEVVSDDTAIDEYGRPSGRQDLLVEILTGEYRGRIVEVQNILFINAPVHAQAGQRIVLHFESFEDGGYFARVHTYERATGIYIIVLLFFGLLAAVGGKAGLRSAFGLVFTFVVLLFLLIPAIVRGAPPGLMTVGLSLVIVAVSLIAIMGFEKKTYVSIAGTTIGIVMYVLFYFMASAALRITGFNAADMSDVITFPFQSMAGISQLLFCGILIASLGAVMDITVSVSSATAELSAGSPDADFKTLFRSSMRMARDCIGSSANTLILAFTGTFFVTLILFRLNNFDYHMIINRTDIAIEVLRALTASAAMVLAAPVTVLIGAHVYCARRREKAK